MTAGSLARSSDGGDSWVLSALPLSSPSSLTVDPDRPDVVYLGGGILTHVGVIERSEDGGRTWAIAFSFPFSLPPLLVVAKAERAVYAISELGTVMKTNDSGKTWTDTAPVFAPVTDTVLAVASEAAGAATALYAVTPSRTYVSRDAGASWVSAGLSPPGNRLRLAAAGGVLIAASDEGVFRSSGGAGWQKVLSEYAVSVAIDASGSVVLTGAGDGVWRSADGGSAFARTPAVFPGEAVFNLLLDRAGGVIAIPSLEGPVFRRTDTGQWEEFSNRPFSRAFAVDPKDPSVQYAFFFPAGDLCGALQKTRDAGSTWIPVGPPVCGGGAIAVDPADSAHLVLAADAGIYVSTDGGATLRLTLARSSAPIAFDPARPGRVYVGGLSSADGGFSWTSGSGPDPFCDEFGKFCEPKALAVDTITGASYGLAYRGAGLFRRADFGGAWSPVPAEGAPGLEDIGVDPSTGDLIAAASGVFRSRDGGVHFEAVDPAGLSDPVSSVLVRPSDGALFAAARGAVWELGATMSRPAPLPVPKRPGPRVLSPRTPV